MKPETIWGRETRPEHCWDWIAREDLPRLALRAWEMAKRVSFPPRGERFLDGDGCSWSSRETFADTLADVMAMLVRSHAHEVGLRGGGLGPAFSAEAERAALWNRPVSTSRPDDRASTPDAAAIAAMAGVDA